MHNSSISSTTNNIAGNVNALVQKVTESSSLVNNDKLTDQSNNLNSGLKANSIITTSPNIITVPNVNQFIQLQIPSGSHQTSSFIRLPMFPKAASSSASKLNSEKVNKSKSIPIKIVQQPMTVNVKSLNKSLTINNIEVQKTFNNVTSNQNQYVLSPFQNTNTSIASMRQLTPRFQLLSDYNRTVFSSSPTKQQKVVEMETQLQIRPTALNSTVVSNSTMTHTVLGNLNANKTATKLTINDQSSSKQPLKGTFVVVGNPSNNSHRPQTLAPKNNQQLSMFVPITMANNIYNSQSQMNGGIRIHQQIAPRLSNPLPSSRSSNVVTINPSNRSFLIPFTPQPENTAQQQYVVQKVTNYQPQYSQSKDFSPLKPIAIKSTPSTISVADSKPVKKPCNCTKSQCLKLYCECFANGEFCSNCNCRTCFNNIAHESERTKAIKSCLDRNPYAFHPKIGKGKIKGDNERRHTKGCNCKRSGCLKNYCECYEAKILCSSLCKCSRCKNFEESADRKTLMHLADAAEVRVLQQTAAQNKLEKQHKGLQKDKVVTRERLMFSFMTADVSKVTSDILLARVQDAESLGCSEVKTEHSVLEEFSRCLNQIIDKSHNAKKRKR